LGLYEQPNDWTCGPFALKHALVALGKLADESAISQVAHPHWWAGTDEVKLARAARAFECDLPFIRRVSPDRAHSSLVRHLNQRLPVILCVDDWGHWVTVVRHEEGRVGVIDSKKAPVLQVLTWPQLRNRWRYYDETDTGRFIPVFDLHPVKPRFRVSIKAQFSVERAHFLRRQDNADLAEYWDEYLSDLLEICRPRTASGRSPRNAMPMSAFLREHEGMLAARLSYWHGELAQDQVFRLLRNFRFVAETYDLAIPAAGQEQVLVDLSMLLGMWAAAGHGVSAMYGAGEE
jgi:hypothetical protein